MRVADLPAAWAALVQERGEDPGRPTLDGLWEAFKSVAVMDLDDSLGHESLEVFQDVAKADDKYAPWQPSGPQGSFLALNRFVLVAIHPLEGGGEYPEMRCFSIAAYFDLVVTEALARFGAEPTSLVHDEKAFRGAGAAENMFAAVEACPGFTALRAVPFAALVLTQEEECG